VQHSNIFIQLTVTCNSTQHIPNAPLRFHYNSGYANAPKMLRYTYIAYLVKNKRVTKVKDKNALEHVVKADGPGADWGTGPLGSYRIGSWLGPRKQ